MGILGGKSKTQIGRFIIKHYITQHMQYPWEEDSKFMLIIYEVYLVFKEWLNPDVINSIMKRYLLNNNITEELHTF